MSKLNRLMTKKETITQEPILDKILSRAEYDPNQGRVQILRLMKSYRILNRIWFLEQKKMFKLNSCKIESCIKYQGLLMQKV
ncbi:hypothetical protein BpHYR1_054556 [Brachionus plicatilis]|uniref:Uncharacterized protein n=1 Tax=Brachionus plicatilis TaxID=10195 RepID=A0A3M7SEU4_BRAPC|nr:hypothetical protein BpHYR1_054556 [Brachionus plicatilis]